MHLKKSEAARVLAPESTEELSSKLAWIAGLGIAWLAFIVLLYLSKFHGELSSDQAVWASFGDFVGGLANPILSLLGLVALLLTIAIQSRELSVSTKQLRRSALAQELAEASLRDQTETLQRQARLNSVNGLIEVYKYWNRSAVQRGDQKRSIEYDKRLKALVGELELMLEVTSSEDE